MSHRRLQLRALLPLLVLLASVPAAADITNASLEIQGIGLSLVTPVPETTTGVDIPTTVQTKFGGKSNDEALTILGLTAVGDLTGPGLDAPLQLSTAPGHKFQIPGLSREGRYTLQNVRLMKGNELLQYASPSSVDIIVADIFKTSVEVRQLSPQEIRDRGIVIDARNFEVYEYTLSFLLRGELVKIPFPVIIDPRTRQVQMMPVVSPYTLPPISTIGVGRWTPPDVIPVTFEDEPLPEDERNAPKVPQEPGEKLYVRPPIPAAIVIPNSLAVMHQFFVVQLSVQNGAPTGSTATLENISARIRVPSQLRTASSKPAVALGQAVPILDTKNNLTILVAQAKAEAEWSVEALKPGTHTIEIELRGTLKENGQEDVPLIARPRASVVVHDARFNIAFSHPDTVRKNIDYTTYSFITNTSPSEQTIVLSNDVTPCPTVNGANVCRVGGELSDQVTIPAGETRTIEYKLRSGVTGKIFATAAHIDSEVAVATAQLHMGVSDTGVPLSPATLVMPHYAQFVSNSLVSETMQILGLGYSLATAPVTATTAKFPRVIKGDVYRRAVDIAQAGQAIFIANDAPGSRADAIAGMAVDLLGNSVELSEWDALRRQQQKYARPAGAAVTRELESAGLASGTSYSAFIDNFAKALSHRPGYVAALVHAPKVGGNDRPFALSVRGMSSNRRMDVPAETVQDDDVPASKWVRDLPYGELTRIAAPNSDRAGELALIGRWTTEDLEVIVTPSVDGMFELELLYPNTSDGSTMRAHINVMGNAGIPVRVPLSRGATTINAMTPSGGFADSTQATVVPLAPLRVVGMRQDMYLDENGHKVSVLFNRPVAAGVPPAELRAKFKGEIDFNKEGVVWMDQPRPISGAALQASGRVIDLTFDHVLTTNASYTIEIIEPLVDPITTQPVSFGGQFLPKIDNDRPAGIIYGRFIRGDNTPLAKHEVILFSGVFNPFTAGAVFEEFENPKRRIPVNPFIQPPQIATTRDDGSYLFEYVPRDMESGYGGDFRLWGNADNLTKYTYVDGAVRIPAHVHPVSLQLLGRGSAEGTVRFDNGEVAKKASVTVGSTAFEGVRNTTTDDNGFYRLEDLPVGPLAFTATDGHGNIGYAAGEIATPGEIEQQDISIYRQPVPKNGSVHGIIRRSDTGKPVMGASVGIFNNGYPLQTLTTDVDGRYTAEKVPAGFISVVAAEWEVSRLSANTDFDLRGDEVRQVDLMLSVTPNEQLATVTGVVLREDPLFPGNPLKHQPVPGALVKIDSMRIVTANELGQFVIPDVPLSAGGKSIGAHDPATRRTERTQVPPLTANETKHIPILLRGLGKGTIRVKLFDARGIAAPEFEMLVKAGGAHFKMEDRGNGVYELGNLEVGGGYLVRTGGVPSEFGDQEVVSPPVQVAFDGQIVSVTLRLPGQGEVRAEVKQISLPTDGGPPIHTKLISDTVLTYSVFNATTLQDEPKEIPGTTNQGGIPGEVIYPGVPALRPYAISSTHPLGHSTDAGMLAFDGDFEKHELFLSNLGHIIGTVYAIDGVTPVPGATLKLSDEHQDMGLVVTGLDGKFEFRNVAPNARVTITAESVQAGIYRTAERKGHIPANGGIVKLDVTLLERGQIDGKVVYGAYKVYDPLHPENNVADNTPDDLSDNAPVPMARFWVRELDFPRRDLGTGVQPLVTDIAGRFAIDNVFVGRLRATAWDPANPDLRGDWNASIVREGELLTPYIAIGDGGTGSLVVKVTNPNANNAVVENAEVQLFRGGLFDLASTGPDGTVRFDQLPVDDNYTVAAYSKALGKSGRSTDPIEVSIDTVAETRILLTFSGQVTGRLTDPESTNPPNKPVPGSHVTIAMAEGFAQRFTTNELGEYLFEGVREGLFTLDAKDTASNRRARRSYLLSAADPEPVVNLELERTETLYVNVYLPDDLGASSGVLAGPVEASVRQRSGEFNRAMQGNPIVMPSLFLNEAYDIYIQELGGDRRTLHTFASFPKGNASNPIKIVYPAYGSGEVLVRRLGAAVADARVSVRVSKFDTRVFYSDAAGRILVNGLPLGRNYSVTVSTLDGASGSGNLEIIRTSVLGSLTIEVGARATVTGKVLAEKGGPSVSSPVVINFAGGQLTATTDHEGRYTFGGVTAPGNIELRFYGEDGSTLGRFLPQVLGTQHAGGVYQVPDVTLDATPPLLLEIVPQQGSGTVPPDTHLKFVFSEKIKTSTVHNAHFMLQPADGTERVEATFSFADGANGTFIVTMVPPAPPAGQNFPLKSNTLYRLVVSQHVTDETGHPLGADRGLTFTTADYVEPRVISTVPAEGTPIPEQITYEFRFNEPLDPAPFKTNGAGRVQLDLMSEAGDDALVLKNIPGDAYIDPFTGISLFFAPSEVTVPNSFYRIKFSGVRDLQGNVVPEQTYRLVSFDTYKPFVVLESPVPAGATLVSGLTYKLIPDVRNGDANGAAALDVDFVDFFRVENGVETFIKRVKKAPFGYDFVAPESTSAGTTLTFRAQATDKSVNESAKTEISLTVKPNQAPLVAVALDRTTDVFAGERLNATVTATDEQLKINVQLDVTGTRMDGSTYRKLDPGTIERSKLSDPWPAQTFAIDLPTNLKGGTKVTVKGIATDMSGLTANAQTEVTLTEDLIPPAIVSIAPADRSEFAFGTTYQISANVTDVGTGVASVTFNVDGTSYTVARSAATGTTFTSPAIPVVAHSVDTVVPITVTATDNNGKSSSQNFEVIYLSVNDPTIPTGEWLCPISGAVLPANANNYPLKLRFRAVDDVSVTSVRFVVPGITDPVEPVSDAPNEYAATVTINTPAADKTDYFITAIVTDANPAHTQEFRVRLSFLVPDITVDALQAITASNVATFQDKSVLVTSADGELVPNVPVRLKNLLVLNGGLVKTLPTTTTTERKLDITVTGTLYVDCASSIDVTGLGYVSANAVDADGTGTVNTGELGRTFGNTTTGGARSSGASHGGMGVPIYTGVTNAVYGSYTEPRTLGAGGGTNSNSNGGGAGGGAIAIAGSDTSRFVIAGGIRADGKNGAPLQGGGAGGSVLLQSADILLSRSARVTANGGDSLPGGGGRVALHVTRTLTMPDHSVQAHGGWNNNGEIPSNPDGGAGTIYIVKPGETAGETESQLLVTSFDEKHPATPHVTMPTPLGTPNGPELVFGSIFVGPRSLLRIDSPYRVTKTDGVTVDPTAFLFGPEVQPAVSFTSAPAAGANVWQNAPIVVTYNAAAEDGLVEVKVSLTGAADVAHSFDYATTAGPREVTIKVPPTAPAGPITLKVRAKTRSERVVEKTATFEVVSDAVPVVKFDSVTPATEVYAGGTIAILGSATDDVEVKSLSLTSSVGGESAQTATKPTPQSMARQFSVVVPKTRPSGSDVVLTLSASDGFPSRPAATETYTVKVRKDELKPAVTVTQPSANQEFSETANATFTIDVQASDAEVGVNTVKATFEGTTYTLAPVSGQPGRYLVANVPIPQVDGTEPVAKTVVVSVTDFEPNTTEVPVIIYIKPLIDANAPKTNWICSSPNAMYPAGTTVPLRVSATAPDGFQGPFAVNRVEYSVNGGPVTAMPLTSTATEYAATYTIPADAAAGTVFNVRVAAFSSSGNEGTLLGTLTVVAGNSITAARDVSATDFSLDNSTVIVGANGVLTVTGPHTFTNLVVLDGGKFVQKHLDIGKADAITVQRLYVACNGTIDVSGLGYAKNTTYPGAGNPNDASGGSHIGRGGLWLQHAGGSFGSIYRPMEGGGGGQMMDPSYPAIAGGGSVRIQASSTVVIDGSVKARVTDHFRLGGAAGGSVWITTPSTIGGGGTIDVTGGSVTTSSGGAGAGGSIALEYANATGTLLNKLIAKGGTGNAGHHGGAGTVYLKPAAAQFGELTIDNRNVSLTYGVTDLPALGRVRAASVSANGIAIEGTRWIMPALAGHTVRVIAPDGQIRGTSRIASVKNDAGTTPVNGFHDVATQDTVAYDGYVYYSPLGVNGKKFVAARVVSGQWQYDNDTAFVTFTPAAGDGVIATFRKDAARVVEITPYRCATLCGSVNGVQVLELAGGEIVPNAIGGGDATNKWELGVRDDAELFLRSDGRLRGLIVSKGVDASITLENPALAHPGDVLRGVYLLDKLTVFNARVTTEDLLEATVRSVDIFSTVTGGNQTLPAIDTAKLSMANGLTGPALIGAAGAAADTDVPLHVIAANANALPATGAIWNGVRDYPIVIGNRGGMSIVRPVNGHSHAAGISTLNAITGSGFVSFSAAQTNQPIVVGLAPADTTSNHTEPQMNAFKLLSNATYEVWANGVNANKNASYSPSTVFRIEKSAAAIRWFVDGVPVHELTSNVPASLLLDLSFQNATGAEIHSIELDTNTAAEGRHRASVATNGSFKVPVFGQPGESIVVRATDGHTYPFSSEPIQAITIGAQFGVASLAISPAELTGGRTATGTVTLRSAAGADGARIVLSSSHATATVPATVVIAAGQTSNTFTVTSTAVTAPLDVTITATYGNVATTAPLRIVKDNIQPVVAVTLPVANTQYNEGNGKIAVQANVTDPDSGVKRVFATFNGATYEMPKNTVKGANAYFVEITAPFIDGTQPVSFDVVVSATDNSDNLTVAPAVSVQVKPATDTTPPTFEWRCSSANAMYPVGYGARLRVFAQVATGKPALQSVQFTITDPNGVSTTHDAVTSGSGLYEYVFTIPDVTDRSVYTVTARAVTGGGGEATLDGSFSVVKGAVELKANSTIAANDAAHDGKSIVIWDNVTVTIEGVHTYDRVSVLPGGKLQSTATKFEVNATAMYVACDAAVDMSNRGYAPNTTHSTATVPGQYNGGSHIGNGGQYAASHAIASTYGSVYQPAEAGGGGNRNGNGGGIVRMQVPTLSVDGAIRANGNGGNDASAGGSVWVTTTTVAGAGTIEARGGNGDRNGGGGAVAIEYTNAIGTILDKANAFGGTNGGAIEKGGAGSVYLKSASSTYGHLRIDNNLTLGGTKLPALGSGIAANGTAGATLATGLGADIPQYFEKLHWVRVTTAEGDVKGTWRIDTIAGRTVTLKPNGSETISLQTGDKWQGIYRFDSVSLKNVTLVSADPIETGEQTLSGTVITTSIRAANLHLTEGTVLKHAEGQKLDIVVTGDLIVDSGASIDLNSLGYGANTSYTGASLPGQYNGGSHIGHGGQYHLTHPVAATFGSVYQPAEAGGGGNRIGNGGGVLRIEAGTLTNNGIIRANGTSVYDASAGGSIWIKATSVGGSGVIEARGGNGERNGGGGAVSIEYTNESGSLLANANAFGGSSGGAIEKGGAGTVYLKPASGTYGDLRIDNGTIIGSTTLPSLGSGTALTGTAGATLFTNVNVPLYFNAHWVRITGANGTVKGTWRISSIAGKSVKLKPNAGETISLEIGDQWQGVYLFDSVSVKNTKLVSLDPIETTEQTLDGAITATEIHATNLRVATGAVLTHPAGQTLDIDVTGELIVDANASIDVSSLGYAANETHPDATTKPGLYNGGSHIGDGGQYHPTHVVASTYGSVYEPSEYGGGGNREGRGGGILRIKAGTLTNNGFIRANGTSVYDASAGGSIWITATNVGGTGLIEARGGNGDRNGGGGAVAIEYTNASGTLLTNANAFGGSNSGSIEKGGAGTVYLKSASSTYGDLRIDNNNTIGGTTLPSLGKGTAGNGTSGATLDTGLTKVPLYFERHWIRVTDANGVVKGTWRIEEIDVAKVVLEPNANETIDLEPGDKWQGVYRFDNVSVKNTRLVSVDPIETAEQTLTGTITTNDIRTNNLRITTGSVLKHRQGEQLEISATGEVLIEPNAFIDASSLGYGANTAYPGATLPGQYNGGSHLGFGGQYHPTHVLASVFGSVYRPAEFGGGGNREGNGGGIVRINAGTLTNNGTIRANGTNVYDGNAGGSIWITATNLAGTGTVEAKGGNGDRSGGGGAVAVEYTAVTGPFLSNIFAYGGIYGGSSGIGGAGTIYLKPSTGTYGILNVLNGGANGQATGLPSLGTGSALAGSANAVLVTDRAVAIPPYFAGHWVEVKSAGGTLKGTWRIASVSNKTMTLAPNGSESIGVQPGDTYQGVYRFDSVTLRTTKLVTADPIRSTNPPDVGTTVVEVNDGPPSFPAAKRSQIVVSSALTGDTVTGPVAAVTDGQTPIKLTVINNNGGLVTTGTANVDGSFSVPVNGIPGDTFTVTATDSHTMPLATTVPVNGTIVELNRIASIAIQPATVSGGSPSLGTIRLIGPARSKGVTVTLSSSSSFATVPASIFIAGGASSGQFAIATSSPATATEVQITGTLAGVSQSASMTITPEAAALADIVLTSSTVEGGASVSGTVVLGAPAPPGGALVMLASDSVHATVPSSVVVPAGQTQVGFTVTTSKVGAASSATISATWGSTDAATLALTACTAMTTVATPSSTAMNTVWFDEAAPSGATAGGDATFDTTQAATGTKSLHFTEAAGVRSWTFSSAPALTVTAADRLVLYALINPCKPPRQLLVQWSDGTVQYRASWGEERIGDKSLTKLNAGSIPAGGVWQRLEVVARTIPDFPATSSKTFTGMTISVDGGEAWIDAAGVAACSTAKAPQPSYLANEVVWFDDTTPPNAVLQATYNWDTTQAASGTVSDAVGTATNTAFAQHYFERAPTGPTLEADNVIVTYVFLDPCNPPREVMLQFADTVTGFNRRAYWGDNLIEYGGYHTVQRRRMGSLPEVGKWVRLEVPVSSMEMTGMTLNGVAFSIDSGRAWFDRVATATRVNLALGKSATQKTLHQKNPDWVPARAVDGNLATLNFMHTDNESQTWWEVDLGAVQPIDSVDVWNATDCCQSRLQNFWVLVSDSEFTSKDLATTLSQPGVTAHYYLRTGGRPSTFAVGRTGRYVRVQLAGSNWLHLSEVQVWAPVSPQPVNLAVGRKASQSSTHQNIFLAASAVNGNSSSDSFAHTNSELEAWWQVDLGTVQPISSIDIDYAFGNNAWRTMSNFYVFVSDSELPTSNKVADTLARAGVSAFYRATPLQGHKLDVNRTGRYVRIQLTGTNYLHPMEVRVWSPSLSISALAKTPARF